MAQRDDSDEEQSIKRMIRAAREFAGDAADDETPLSPEEVKIMDEIRAQHRRPTVAELAEMARKLARKR